MRRFAVLLFLLTFIAGCGYHANVGKATNLPASVHTIAIPAFQNKTQMFKVEQVLTSGVVREFTTRTQYRIVNTPDEDTDATLQGVVTSAELAPVTYDSQTGRASTALVTITAQVKLVDRNGKVLFSNPNYTFREQYQVSREISSFFEEESPAVDRLSRDFARTLVSNILEAY